MEPTPRACAHCGHDVAAGAEFCPNCGTRVAEAASPAPARTSGGSAVGCLVGGLSIVGGAILGALGSALLTLPTFGFVEQSKTMTGVLTAAIFVVIVLLAVLAVRLGRSGSKVPAALKAFGISFAVVCAGGLALCSSILVVTLFSK
jgi:hypothetical protein